MLPHGDEEAGHAGHARAAPPALRGERPRDDDGAVLGVVVRRHPRRRGRRGLVCQRLPQLLRRVPALAEVVPHRDGRRAAQPRPAVQARARRALRQRPRGAAEAGHHRRRQLLGLQRSHRPVEGRHLRGQRCAAGVDVDGEATAPELHRGDVQRPPRPGDGAAAHGAGAEVGRDVGAGRRRRTAAVAEALGRRREGEVQPHVHAGGDEAEDGVRRRRARGAACAQREDVGGQVRRQAAHLVVAQRAAPQHRAQRPEQRGDRVVGPRRQLRPLARALGGVEVGTGGLDARRVAALRQVELHFVRPSPRRQREVAAPAHEQA